MSTKYHLNGPADFETAISATGFGKYNLMLLLIAIPARWAIISELLTMSFVSTAAQCDLNLNLEDKGLLNAMTFLGITSSSVIWGFFNDALGRRKLIMIGFGLDAVCVLASSLSQTKTFLLIAKCLGGFVIVGPLSAFMSYVSEFHSAKYRARMQLILGAIYSIGSIVVPLMALLILPQNYDFSISNNLFTILNFHSWHIFLLAMSIPSIISAIVFIFLPESPKFLMTIGQNDQALAVFKKMYTINSGNPESTYPIKELVDEVQLKKEDPPKIGGDVSVQALKQGLQQIKHLVVPPHSVNLALILLINCLLLMSYQTLRMWAPEIFQSMNDYQHFNNETSANLCVMLEVYQISNKTDEECAVNFNNSSVYLNAVIVGSACTFSCLFVGFLINLGKKTLLTFLQILCGISTFAIYFAVHPIAAVAFFSLSIACGISAVNVLMAVTIDLFPTKLRSTTLSLGLMFANIGMISGNLLFPLLLRSGCGPPFFTLGSFAIVCAILTILLPNTNLKALE